MLAKHLRQYFHKLYLLTLTCDCDLLDKNKRIILGSRVGGFVLSWEASSSFFFFPEIRDSLGGGNAIATSWILTITGVVTAALLLQAGRLGEKIGYQSLYRSGILLFATGTILSALSPNLSALILARAITAVGLAVMAPAGTSIITSLAPSGKEGFAIARLNFIIGMSGVLGPIVTTLLINNFSWRYGYLSSLPFTLLALFITWKDAEVPGLNKQRKIAPVDSFLCALAIGLLVFALSKSDEWGWVSAYFLTGSGLALFLAFFLIRKSQLSEDPQIPLFLFKKRIYRFSAILAFVIAIPMFSGWIVLLLFMTDIWNFGIVKAGLFLTVMPATMLIFVLPGNRTANKFGYFPVIFFGGIIYSLCFFQFWYFAGEKESVFHLLIAVFGAGFGMALIWNSATSAASLNLESDRMGSALGLIKSLERIGSALGIALTTALITNVGSEPTATLYKRGILVIIIGSFTSALLAFGFIKKKSTIEY